MHRHCVLGDLDRAQRLVLVGLRVRFKDEHEMQEQAVSLEGDQVHGQRHERFGGLECDSKRLEKLYQLDKDVIGDDVKLNQGRGCTLGGQLRPMLIKCDFNALEHNRENVPSHVHRLLYLDLWVLVVSAALHVRDKGLGVVGRAKDRGRLVVVLVEGGSGAARDLLGSLLKHVRDARVNLVAAAQLYLELAGEAVLHYVVRGAVRRDRHLVPKTITEGL
jgi:hypothetical protein